MWCNESAVISTYIDLNWILTCMKWCLLVARVRLSDIMVCSAAHVIDGSLALALYGDRLLWDGVARASESWEMLNFMTMRVNPELVWVWISWGLLVLSVFLPLETLLLQFWVTASGWGIDQDCFTLVRGVQSCLISDTWAAVSVTERKQSVH